MKLSDKREISNLENSTAYQAGGDIVVNHGLKANDVIAIVKTVVASELAIYTQKAEGKAEERLKKFSVDLVGKLAEKVSERLDRFNEPSLQFAVREAALGYVRSGSEVDENNLIDLMIERVKVEEHSTKQKLIDQAIKIVPTLSAESLAMLSLLAFRQLSFNGNKSEYIKWVASVDNVIDVVSSIASLDIEYLQQAGCTTGMTGLRVHKSWEDTCAQTEDLLFRHMPSEDKINVFLEAIGIRYEENAKGYVVDNNAENPTQLLIVFASSLIDLSTMKVDFNIVSSSAINELITKNGLDYVQQPLKTLIDSSTPYTKEEIVNFFVGINPNWKKAVDLLNSEQVTSLRLTPVGAYIGSRQLALLSGKEISIDIFYH